MKINLKIVKGILIYFLILISIVFISVIEKGYRYKKEYCELYNLYYRQFSQCFLITGKNEYIDGKRKIIDANFSEKLLAKRIKNMGDRFNEEDNYLDFFSEFSFIVGREQYNKLLFEIELDEQEIKTLVSKLKIDIDIFNATSNELNEWLDKAVKEYILEVDNLQEPKGF